MSEATRDNQDLEASVAALLSSEAAKPEPQNGPAGEPPAGVTAPSPPPASAPRTEPTPKQGAGGAAAPEPEDDLAKAVEKLIQEAPPPSPSSTAAPPAKIETLDAQIADLADDLIAGEFADEASVVRGGLGEPPPKEPPPPPSGSERPAPAAPAQERKPVVEPAAPGAQATPPVQPEPEPEPEPTPAVKTISKPPPPIAKSSASSREVAHKAAKVAAKQGAKAARTLKPHGLKLAELISAPLLKKPKPFRDLIGWIALVTLFNAACLWMYVLFFRSAKAPESTTPVVSVERAGAVKDEKADKKDDKSKKQPSKKDAAKKDAAKKDAAKKDAGKKKTAQAQAGEH